MSKWVEERERIRRDAEIRGRSRNGEEGGVGRQTIAASAAAAARRCAAAPAAAAALRADASAAPPTRCPPRRAAVLPPPPSSSSLLPPSSLLLSRLSAAPPLPSALRPAPCVQSRFAACTVSSLFSILNRVSCSEKTMWASSWMSVSRIRAYLRKDCDTDAYSVAGQVEAV